MPGLTPSRPETGPGRNPTVGVHVAAAAAAAPSSPDTFPASVPVVGGDGGDAEAGGGGGGAVCEPATCGVANDYGVT